MMTGEMVAVLTGEAVTCRLTEEVMIVGVPLAHIEGIGVVLTMDVEHL